MFGQIFFYFLDQLGVMGTALVEPEEGEGTGCAGAGDPQFHPIPDRSVLGLAHAPDVVAFDVMFQQRVSRRVDDPDRTVAGRLEGLRMGAVFLRFLRHQTDVRHRAHLGRIERAVFLAELDRFVIDTGIARIGDDAFDVALFVVGPPSLAARPDERRHGGVDDDVARDMQVGDAAIGIDHIHRRAGFEGGFHIRLDLGLFIAGQRRDLIQKVADTHVGIDAEFVERIGMFGKDVFQEHRYAVAEYDGVGNLHHCGFQVEGEQHALLFGLGDLGGEEAAQRFVTHHR